MKQHKNFILTILLLIILIIVLVFIIIKRLNIDNIPPTIALKGELELTLTENEPYIEKGYTAIDNIDGNISHKVDVTGYVNIKKVGEYHLEYKVSDSAGNKTSVIRKIHIIAKISYKKSYDNIDNNVNAWWTGNKFNYERPVSGYDINVLKKYNAYFLGPNEKKIYLTFDEGSNNTYIKEIIEVLNKNNIKATFFLCGHYIISNPEILKELISSGHSIGNHTYHHVNMPNLAKNETFNEFIDEITKNEKKFYELTGATMDKIYREPKGEWSYRSLEIIKDLGYKTFFWSADYLDFLDDVSQQYAYSQLIKRYHNGAIYLLHPKNKGNYLALDHFIKTMKSLGYTFDLVKNIS